MYVVKQLREKCKNSNNNKSNDKLAAMYHQGQHRSDSYQSADCTAILFCFGFKFHVTKVENPKHSFGGELIFLPY